MPKTDTVNVQASVPLPSADLITYRFDKIDATLDKFDKKLEAIAAAYVTRNEVEERFREVENKLEKLKESDDRQQGTIDATRRITSIGLTVAGLILTALFIYVSYRVGSGK